MTPSGWSILELGSLTTFLGRGKAPKYIDDPAGVYAINQKCVRNGKIDVMHARPHEADSLVKAEAILQDGDVCVNSTGTGTIGRVGLWVNPTGETYFADTHVTIARPDTGQVEPKFLAEALQLPDIQRRMESECFTGSTNQVELSRTAFGALQILVPPLPEQKKIAAILGSVDDAIQATQAVIDQTRKVKQGLLQQLLTHGIGHTRFKQTEIGEIPEGWSVCTLEAFSLPGKPVLRTGPFGSSLKTEHFRPAGRPVLTIQSLGDGEVLEDGLYFVDDNKAIELRDYEVSPGDLVFSRVADIGRSVVIPQHGQGWIISSNLMRMSVDHSRINPQFLMYLITSSPQVLGQLDKVSLGGGGRPVISGSIVKKLLFPVPSLAEQLDIVASLDRVSDGITNNLALLGQLEVTKQGLMTDLLTGRKRVEVLA